MRPFLLTVALLFSFGKINAQSLYFPPLTGNAWETLPPDSLGWCDDKIQDLYDLLETNHTKAFLLLKDGRIVLEKYFGTFTQDSVWYWASAGKTMTASLVGIAQQENLLDINDPTSDYLGAGWTACPPDKEALITVRHQLTMTSGLDDGVPDVYCTLDTCLQYLADAGARWAYHNAPYTLLDQVIETASGQNFNLFFNQKITQKTGITGAWLPAGYNNVLFSKARSMARFGILTQNNGTWNTTPVLTDPAYFQAMTTPSQDLNLSYGYLWWLNGQPTYKLPGLQINIPGPLFPAAPDDMISALGKNGQYLNVVPSQGIVVVRMGEAPGTGIEVPVVFNNDIWVKINELACESSGVLAKNNPLEQLQFYPNPTNDFVQILGPNPNLDCSIEVYDRLGRLVLLTYNTLKLEVAQLEGGLFSAVVRQEGKTWAGRFLVK
ncbi:MAG: serine hydrolase [Saprospiraceae bacterium]|nr:serine hydrolase [Saprospiraceae bacterium]MCF8248495.1 serine hydrolase [Saprospiraceae bacterium]MCF8280566.1 serine hydrolase [Bacteroidales bacterium]MCF8310229.1 serine hydrolase [Saprospiraceae bacterium]MCF8439332.1 serine hydrolase [Saprospiraceae bacterium]